MLNKIIEQAQHTIGQRNIKFLTLSVTSGRVLGAIVTTDGSYWVYEGQKWVSVIEWLEV